MPVELFSSFCSGGRRRIGGFIGGLLIKGPRSRQLRFSDGAALPSAGHGGEGAWRRGVLESSALLSLAGRGGEEGTLSKVFFLSQFHGSPAM
jgi:hypothetical protein